MQPSRCKACCRIRFLQFFVGVITSSGKDQRIRRNHLFVDAIDRQIESESKSMSSSLYLTKWKWCALTSLALVLLSLLPQIHLWIVRGRDWNGAYVSSQGDEPLYSGYVNALIEGRTRKNDPFGGKDSSASAPLPESAFSIQLVPAYVVSSLART